MLQRPLSAPLHRPTTPHCKGCLPIVAKPLSAESALQQRLSLPCTAEALTPCPCMQQPSEEENAIYEDENGNQEVPPEVGVVFNVSVIKGDECLV